MNKLSFTPSSIDPHFLTGFVQADGSFFISIEKRHWGECYIPVFSITQKDTPRGERSPLLEECNHFFSGGHWLRDKRCNCHTLKINSPRLLLDRVLPHFSAAPLHSEKAQDLLIFKRCLLLLQERRHLEEGGRRALLELAYSMNRTSQRFRKECTPERKKRLEADLLLARESRLLSPLEPALVSGLIQGDGGFGFSFLRNPHVAKPFFSLGQHTLSLSLLRGVQSFFGCGGVYQRSKDHWAWTCSSVKELRERVLPHFLHFPLRDEKARQLKLFRLGCEISSRKGGGRGEKSETLAQLVDLLYDSNEGGKRRRINREDYLRSFQLKV